MFPKPKSVLVPNTYAFESEPMVKATGFREYDARWLFNKEINLMGIQALGMGLGALIAELGAPQEGVNPLDKQALREWLRYSQGCARRHASVVAGSDLLEHIGGL